MTPRAKAVENVDHFVTEIRNGLQNDQHNVLREMPLGGHTYLRMLASYERRLRELADRCKRQFEWIDGQPDLLRDWKNGEGWLEFSTSRVEQLWGDMNARLNTVVSSLGGGTVQLTDVQGRLIDIRDDVQTKLADAIGALCLESKGKAHTARKERWLQHTSTFGAQIVTGIISLIVGLVVGLGVEHYKSAVTPASSCQSSSTLASSSPVPTPQPSRTSAPSARQTADPSHVTHSVPANPSSSLRP